MASVSNGTTPEALINACFDKVHMSMISLVLKQIRVPHENSRSNSEPIACPEEMLPTNHMQIRIAAKPLPPQY